jgi:hypothetical protein
VSWLSSRIISIRQQLDGHPPAIITATVGLAIGMWLLYHARRLQHHHYRHHNIGSVHINMNVIPGLSLTEALRQVLQHLVRHWTLPNNASR